MSCCGNQLTLASKAFISERSGQLIVSLDEARAHLRLSTKSFDGRVNDALEAATEFVEGRSSFCCRLSMKATQMYGCFPLGEVRLDMQPATAIDSVTYVDDDGADQPIAAENYRLLPSTHGSANLEFASSFSPPSLTTGLRSDRVKIDYTCQVTETPRTPKLGLAKSAVKLALAELFGNLDERQMANNRKRLDSLIAQLKPGHYN